MAYLFSVENRVVMPTAEALLISPYKDIWNRDKSKDKQYAIEDFSYIEFMSSMKKSNPYSGYDEDLKHEKIKEDIITRKNWKPDALISKAIDKIKEFQEKASVTYSYYMSNKRGAEQMKSFFNTLNISEVNSKTGNPLYKPKDITSALNDANRTLETLDSMKEKVEQELFETTKNKGQKEISPFADPDSI
jgi:hypothetical protein